MIKTLLELTLVAAVVTLAACMLIYQGYQLGRQYAEAELEAQAVLTHRLQTQLATETRYSALVTSLNQSVRATSAKCAAVLDTCVVPGHWYDAGVTPLPRKAAESARRP